MRFYGQDKYNLKLVTIRNLIVDYRSHLKQNDKFVEACLEPYKGQSETHGITFEVRASQEELNQQ